MNARPKSLDVNPEGGKTAPKLTTLEQAKAAAKPDLREILALQGLRLALRLGFIILFANVVAGLTTGGQPNWRIWAAIALLMTAIGVGWLAESRAVKTENKVSQYLRGAIANHLATSPARNTQALASGETIAALQRFSRAVATLVVSHSIARSMMAMGPLASATALAIVSWQAAALLLVLTPLMIVFFALVGETIRKRAEDQERAFGHLAGQFADRIRALPTIVSNHAVEVEAAKLGQRLDAYAENTMHVLRIAFLNAGIIDFFASLSIAMLAVFLGLGHLQMISLPGFSDLALWQSLFILMVAPEYFAPFRRYAEQYHAKAEGEAAAVALDRLSASLEQGSTAPEIALPSIVIDWKMPGLTAITGPSGSGKTTLLRHLSGIDEPPELDGRQPAFVWISTDVFMPQGSVAEAVAWNTGATSLEQINRAAAATGLLDDRLLPQALATPVLNGGENLSGGQRLRIAVARALLSNRPVIADEPTAKLDRVNADRVAVLLQDMAQTRAVLVATHDEALATRATQRIRLSHQDAQPDLTEVVP